MREEDSPIFHRMFDQDEAVWKLEPGHTCQPQERLAWTLRHASEPEMAAGRSGLFGRTVVRREDNCVLGAAGLLAVLVPGGLVPQIEGHGSTVEVTLFYQLGSQFWRQGYMKEAGARLLHFGLQELGLPRIFCATQAHNTAAIALMDSLGFTEKIEHQPGPFWGANPVCGIIRRKAC